MKQTALAGFELGLSITIIPATSVISDRHTNTGLYTIVVVDIRFGSFV